MILEQLLGIGRPKRPDHQASIPVNGKQHKTEPASTDRFPVRSWRLVVGRASSCFYDADASSELGCSRYPKQPCPDKNEPDGSRASLTSRCETFEGDSCRHDSHRA